MASATQGLDRTLILAPIGRDAAVAQGILREANVHAQVCRNDSELLAELERGASLAIIAEEATRNADLRPLNRWVLEQPVWSDFPFIVLTRHGGGVERNPTAAHLVRVLGNVSFLERPFHPTTLVSVAQTGLRGRQRQYECRRLNEELELRVRERTAQLEKANEQLLKQIEERERVESTLNQLSLPILFVTGFADRAALVGVKDSQIIGKPFLDDELTTKIQLALSAGVGDIESHA